MKPLLFLLAAMMLVACAVPVYGAEFMYHQYRTTLLVTDPERSSDLIIEWVEDEGG